MRYLDERVKLLPSTGAANGLFITLAPKAERQHPRKDSMPQRRRVSDVDPPESDGTGTCWVQESEGEKSWEADQLWRGNDPDNCWSRMRSGSEETCGTVERMTP